MSDPVFADLLTHAQKVAIAHVAIESAAMETEIQLCVMDLCRLRYNQGEVLLKNVRLDAKTDIFFQLVQLEFPDSQLPDNFKFLREQLKNLNAQRNTIIHGEWIPLSYTSIPITRNQFADQKDIVAVRKRGSKPPDPVSAKAVSRVAVLMALNRRLLRRLFWEYFPDRVQGLSGIPANEKITAGKLRTLIERLKN